MGDEHEDLAESTQDTDAGTPDAPGPVTEGAAWKDRVVRRRVLLAISPLMATLFVPWPDGFSWEVAERLDSTAFLTIPLVAFAATLVALAKRRSLLVRSLILGALGVALVGLSFDAITSPALVRKFSSDVGRWDAYVLYLGLGIPLFTITLELFAALDRRSRPRAILAGFGWLTLAAGYLIPFRSDRLEEMPLIMMAEAIVRGRPKSLLAISPMVLLLLLALGAAALTVLRLIGDPERRQRWRPRSGCLAIGLGVLPAVLALLGLTLGAFVEDIEFLGVAYNVSSYILGFFVGVPVALASGLDGLAVTFGFAAGKGEPNLVRRARFGVGAVGAVGVLWCLALLVSDLLPDRREARAAEELLDVVEVIIDTSAGEAVDPRFVGGYSEFDLRSSVGVLGEVIGSGAEPTFEYATFEIVVVGNRNGTIEVGLSPDGELRYLSGASGGGDRPPQSSLRRASEPIAGLVDRITEGLSSLACLPAEAPPVLPGLVDAHTTVATLCHAETSSGRRRIRDIGRTGDGWGGTGRYRVWVRSGTDMHRLEGRLYSHESRLWIGRAALSPNANP